MPKNKGLSIVIVGCGKVGVTLVEQLSREGHDITVIDKDRSLVEYMSGTYDVMALWETVPATPSRRRPVLKIPT